MHFDGKDTTELPLRRRKRLLRDAIEFDGPLRYTPQRLQDDLGRLPDGVCGDERVIATAPKGSRVELGALLLGYHEGRDLVYAGKVGAGFDEETLRSLHKKMVPNDQEASLRTDKDAEDVTRETR